MTALDNVALPLVYAGVTEKGPQRAGAGSTGSRRAGGACQLYPDSAFRWTEAACGDRAGDGEQAEDSAGG